MFICIQRHFALPSIRCNLRAQSETSHNEHEYSRKALIVLMKPIRLSQFYALIFNLVFVNTVKLSISIKI